MSKYSLDFKMKLVELCLSNNTTRGVARKFGMPSSTPLKEWVKKYQEHGIDGLKKCKKTSYSGDFKQDVIKYMHVNHLSATETAIHFNIQTTSVLKWERIYYEEGPQSLYIERCDRSRNMNFKPAKKDLNKNIEENLIAENQRLRMENEYLKKLNALVQERIKRENKKK